MSKDLFSKNYNLGRNLVIGAMIAFGTILLLLILLGRTWRAAAYLTVASFACLIALAIFITVAVAPIGPSTTPSPTVTPTPTVSTR